MADLRLRSIDEADIETVLAEDVDFDGKLFFENSLLVKGRIVGSLQAQGPLYIADTAVVSADLEAPIVSVRGRVKGSIRATERVEIFRGAIVDGDVETPSLVVEQGARLHGSCTMQVGPDEFAWEPA